MARKTARATKARAKTTAKTAAKTNAKASAKTSAKRSAKTKRIKRNPLLGLVQKSLDDDKARDLVVIDLIGKSSIADYMVIATGTSARHVAAMAEHLRERIKAKHHPPPPIEGLAQGDWVLIDAGDVIVHLFRPEIRRFYNLEKMWGGPFPEAEPERLAL